MGRPILASLCACVGVFLAGPALADVDEPDRFLSAGDIRAELFGTILSGHEVRSGDAWRECIDPEGRTLYTWRGEEKRGELRTRKGGFACYNYGGPDHCFRIKRVEGGYQIGSWGTIYAVTHIQRGVETCAATDLIG